MFLKKKSESRFFTFYFIVKALLTSLTSLDFDNNNLINIHSKLQHI